MSAASGYPGSVPGYGLYGHHFSKLRGPHDLNGAYSDYPSKPQQAVPTYKWMQVKRNVPKPGKKTFSYIFPLFELDSSCGVMFTRNVNRTFNKLSEYASVLFQFLIALFMLFRVM